MPESDFRDFEIHIHQPPASDACPVTVYYATEDRRGRGSLRYPYSDAEVNNALMWMERGIFEDEAVKEFGATLFRALFAGDLKRLYDSCRQSSGNRLRYRLIVDAPSFARLPWELLYDPDRAVFLALEGPFVRGASLAEATRPIAVASLPLRILVVDAFPRGVLQIENQAETDGIRQALADLIRRRRVEVETLSHATVEKLQNALREAANPEHPRPFHVLHFIGHGLHDPASGRTALLFENPAGRSDAVEPERLTNIVGEYDLKLVFLNACQSLQSSALDVTQGFAPRLLASGVPAVVGMQTTVLDPLAVQISRQFYEAVADNRPVDAALADARRLLSGPRERCQSDPGIPVCYLRTATGRILELEPLKRVPLTRETLRPWLRQQATPGRVWTAGGSLVGVVSGLVGIYTFILPLVTPLPPMDGSFNVAVAKFDGADGASQDGERLAGTVYELLERDTKDEDSIENKAGATRYRIKVRDLSKRESIPGATERQRAEAAEQLATRNKAHVIVYGSVKRSDTTISFAPEFYLSRVSLPAAEDLLQGPDNLLRRPEGLSGQYQLGAEISVDRGSQAAQDDLTEFLAARTHAFARFVRGLDYLALGRYDRAEEWFQAAAARWHQDDERAGKALFYHFLGNAAGMRGDFDAAGKHYAEALRASPEFARAQLGAAEVRFQTARDRCAPNAINATGVEEAIKGYQGALQARIQPALSDIETKAALGLGRAYVCLSLAGIAEHWTDAERELRQVIADFDGGNQRVKDLAAEAHASLGLVYRPDVGDPEPESRFRRAAEEYRKAIERSQRSPRQASFYGELGFIHRRLKEYDQADAAYAEAIRLDPNNRAAYEDGRRRLQQERAGVSGTPPSPVLAGE